jgi:putative ABC transport system permease protein
MKRDLLQQAYGAMRHDMRKTVLTMLGMAWGIATVVLLLAYGEGFGRAIQAIFDSYGSRAVGIFPGRTSQQAGGNKAGVPVRFTAQDLDLLRNVAPLIKHISRESDKDATVQSGSRSFSFPVIAIDPTIVDIWNLEIDEGRFIDDQDNISHGHYAAICSEARDKLFSGMNALGETIRLNGVTFQVIGVLHPRMQEADNDDNRVIYIPFTSMDVLQDNYYLGGIWLDFEGLDHIQLTKTIRSALAMQHGFKIEDERAVFIFDAQKQLS